MRGLILLCAVLAVTRGAAQSPEENWLRTRLRVSFTANEASTWGGRISLSEGRVERLQPLNTDPVIASGTQLRDGEVVLLHREPLARDVVDLTMHGPPDSEILLRIGGAESRVSLSEIRQEGSQRTELDKRVLRAVDTLARRSTPGRDGSRFAPFSLRRKRSSSNCWPIRPASPGASRTTWSRRSRVAATVPSCGDRK